MDQLLQSLAKTLTNVPQTQTDINKIAAVTDYTKTQEFQSIVSELKAYVAAQFAMNLISTGAVVYLAYLAYRNANRGGR